MATGVLAYLLELKGKPGYKKEYDRLRPILCDEDVKELDDLKITFYDDGSLTMERVA